MSMPAFLVVDGVIIAVTWKLWNRLGRWQPAFCALLAALLGFGIWATDTQRPSPGTSTWLGTLIPFAVYFLIPALAVVVAARLIGNRNRSTSSVDQSPVFLFLRWLVAFGFLFLVGYQIMLGSIWDVATDGLRGLSLLLVVGLTAIAATLILLRTLPGRWKLSAIAFVMLVFFIMEGAHRLGTYDPDGKWGKLPTLMTEQRAETIDLALQRYHARNGRYPDSLNDLTPQYLLYLPAPFIIPGQTWCYQGGPDYYRIGYLYREYFSSPTSVRIHATAGEPPDSAGLCP